MKSLSMIKGNALLRDTISPYPGDKEILVINHYSAISVGTELAAMRNSELFLLQKINPVVINKVLNSVTSRGILGTTKMVGDNISKLEKTGIKMGYSSCGVVSAKGELVSEFQVGDRVACAGAGYASHSEVVSIPKNLAVKIPDNVSFEEAAFTTIGAIALQGVRRCNITLGETVVVIGLGLIGLMTIQIAKANGARVIGFDIHPGRVGIAKSLGFEHCHVAEKDDVRTVMKLTGMVGADAVIITAASKDSKTINASLEMCRKKGRVIVVGDVKLHIERDLMYAKELDVGISTSYGPGRYDPEYEENGLDYPLPYVRWTENRNMSSFLGLISDGSVKIKPLISKVYDFSDADKAYTDLASDRNIIGALFRYQKEVEVAHTKSIENTVPKTKDVLNLTLIGPGGFAQAVHLQNIKDISDVRLHSLVGRNADKLEQLGKAYKVSKISTNIDELLEDKTIDALFITTQHDSHAQLAIKALRKGKHVFVEKPLAITSEELDAVEKEMTAHPELICMVGHNRRFAPMINKIKEMLSGNSIFTYLVDAGFVPYDHWAQKPEVGGGRIVGEGVHFIDTLEYLAGSVVTQFQSTSVSGNGKYKSTDNKSIQLVFANGSVANLTYTSMGSQRFGKEQLFVYNNGKTIRLDDYKELYVDGKKLQLQPGKGHKEELEYFINACLGRVKYDKRITEDAITATRVALLSK